MSQLPLIMAPKINFFGRRVFVEVKPTDNPDMLAIEFEKAMSQAIQVAAERKMDPVHPQGAKIIA